MQPIETEGTRSDRIELLATPQEKALLMRAAAIENLDITSFIMRAALPAAQEVVERTEHDTQQMQQTTDDSSQNTGKDLIAFFRNSPLADVAIERIKLSERDTLFVLDLLENPPPPNAKLIAAAKAWAENQKKLEEMQ